MCSEFWGAADWESLLYDIGEVPVAQTVRPDASLLGDYSNVREVVISFLGKGPHTFHDMRRIAANHAKVWTGLDRSFSLELSFLQDNAETLSIRQVHRAVLNSLPCDGDHKLFSQVLGTLQEISSSHRCLACGPGMVAEVDGVRSMVGSLDEGIGVSAKDLTNFSAFYQMVVSRLQFFYKKVESGPDSGPFKKTLCGRLAIIDLYDTIVCKKSEKVPVTMKDLQPLRTFKWMLTAGQVATVQEWISAATLAHAGMLSSMLGDKLGECDEAGGEIMAASASSCAGVPPPKKK